MVSIVTHRPRAPSEPDRLLRCSYARVRRGAGEHRARVRRMPGAWAAAAQLVTRR